MTKKFDTHDDDQIFLFCELRLTIEKINLNR